MKIDELARRAGTTSRNIRAYQSRGVLPPPRLSGRTGLYDEEHLTRLKLISRLQERGFALDAIKELLAAWDQGSSLSDILGFEDVLTAPWSDELPQAVSVEQLTEWFPEIADQPSLLERAVDLGLLAPDGDLYSAPSPKLIKVGAELVRVGIPLAAVLDQAQALKQDAEVIAGRFVDLFTKHVWEAFLAGRSVFMDLTEVTEALMRVRPLASESVQAFLAQAMERKVQAAIMEGIEAGLAGESN